MANRQSARKIASLARGLSRLRRARGRRAEEALAASEARLRSMVNLSNDIFWETDAKHRFVAQEYSNRSVISHVQSEIGKTRWEVPYSAPDAEGWRRHRAQPSL